MISAVCSTFLLINLAFSSFASEPSGSIYCQALEEKTKVEHLCSNIFKQWPAFTLHSIYRESNDDLIVFEEANLNQIEEQAEKSGQAFFPLTQRKEFDKLFYLNNPEIRWHYFASATFGSHVSGFSQGIGMSTALIKDELFLEVQAQQFDYKYDKKYNRHYNGNKYRLDTALHWHPSENFSMHLGIGTWIDK